jgi:hypothetical protein
MRPVRAGQPDEAAREGAPNDNGRRSRVQRCGGSVDGPSPRACVGRRVGAGADRRAVPHLPLAEAAGDPYSTRPSRVSMTWLPLPTRRRCAASSALYRRTYGRAVRIAIPAPHPAIRRAAVASSPPDPCFCHSVTTGLSRPAWGTSRASRPQAETYRTRCSRRRRPATTPDSDADHAEDWPRGASRASVGLQRPRDEPAGQRGWRCV